MTQRQVKKEFCRQAGQKRLTTEQSSWDWKSITKEINEETESILYWESKKVIIVK